jgi:hypothetical protein
MSSLSQAKELVQFVVDDALNGRRLGADQHAIIREKNQGFQHASVIVVCDCKNGGPIGVAVHSYLDVSMSIEESIDLATDFLDECGADVISTLECY